MAAPNLNSSTLTVNAKVDSNTPSGVSEVDLTTNATSSNHTYISLSLTVANNTASGVAARVNYHDGTSNHRILYDAVVPGNATIEVAPTRKFLLEGQKVKIQSGSANALEFSHHYLDCS